MIGFGRAIGVKLADRGDTTGNTGISVLCNISTRARHRANIYG
jgi:hypothetical protein